MSNDLKEKDLQVLRLVADYEPARSSTISEALHWADDSSDVAYRLQKLEDSGLIRRREVESESTPINPKEARITEDGHDMIAELNEVQMPRTLDERVKTLEKQLGAMRSTYGEVKQRILSLEDEIDSLDGEVNVLDDDLDELARTVERLTEAFADADPSAEGEKR